MLTIPLLLLFYYEILFVVVVVDLYAIITMLFLLAQRCWILVAVVDASANKKNAQNTFANNTALKQKGI